MVSISKCHADQVRVMVSISKCYVDQVHVMVSFSKCHADQVHVMVSISKCHVDQVPVIDRDHKICAVGPKQLFCAYTISVNVDEEIGRLGIWGRLRVADYRDGVEGSATSPV
jgi:hypothetical protein